MWCMSIYTVPDRAVASYYFVNHRQVGFYDVTVTSSGSVPVLHGPTFMWSRSAPFLAAARWVRIIGCSGYSLATLLFVLLRITVCCHCSVLLFCSLAVLDPRVGHTRGRTFSIYPCPLSFWLTLPWRVLSTSWCCLHRPCVTFLACLHERSQDFG